MMRGLQTTVKNIRRRVFTEVAKLGFKADAETLLDDMESIPYEIVNDDTQKYRESTYRSRAIVRERLRLAMGLSLRPENKPVHLTAGVEASNISEKYYEPPLMQVIPSACEACEERGYEVSNMCKGCLAHPCMEVCPKGAISLRIPLAFTLLHINADELKAYDAEMQRYYQNRRYNQSSDTWTQASTAMLPGTATAAQAIIDYLKAQGFEYF